MKIVDPLNPMPKYLQISAWLKELIQSGRYQQGEKLPSEVELSVLCSVHRNTLRQAIADLVSQGFLKKEKGMGTFVSKPHPVAVKHKLKQISSFSDDLKEIGASEKTIILEKKVQKAGEHVANALFLGSSQRTIVIRRLRTGDDVPLIYEESYLPYDMFSPILKMDLTGSMYKIISKNFDTVLERSEQTIRAVNLKGKVASLLTLPENSAGLFMESITFDDGNMPIELLLSYYRGDKYVFEIELGKYHIKENAMMTFNVANDIS